MHDTRRRSTALSATLLATSAAAVVTFLADGSFALCREPVFNAAYVIYNAGATLAAFSGAALLSHLLRGGPLLALSVCAGVEGLAFQGAGVGLSMFGGTMLGLLLRGRGRSLGGGQSASAPLDDGVSVGLAISVTLILGMRVLVARSWLGNQDLSIAGWTALLMLAQLGLLGLYDALRPRIRRLTRLAPSPLWIAAAAFAGLFVALPSSFGSQRDRVSAELRREEGGDKPHVLIVVLDTVRADRLQIYGYHRDTTPRLARRVANHPGATVYPMVFSPASWTAPAHASLFSGLYSFQHGVHYGGAGAYSYGTLPKSPTLAETMKEAGYLTAGIFANITLFRIGGGDRGFDVYMKVPTARRWLLFAENARKRWFQDFLLDCVPQNADARAVNESVLRFFDECGEGPCFVLANFMDAHDPLSPHPPHAGMYSSDSEDGKLQNKFPSDHYDEAIRSLDEGIDELFVALEARGVLERTWVFVTSDHGEGFEEHVSPHGHPVSVYNEEVRIPLVVLPPAGAAELPRWEHPVSLVDVTATATGIAGRLPLGAGHDLREPVSALAPIWSELYSTTKRRPLRAVIYGHAKLVDRAGEGRELYYLDADPTELDDRAAHEPDRAAALAQLLPRDEDVRVQVENPDRPSFEDEAALRALGYVE